MGFFSTTPPKPLCYKINLSISPEWKEILGLIVPEKYKDNPFKFTSEIIEEIKKDPEAEIDYERSLLQKSFHFVYFYSELTGMEQIWSNFYKNFVDDMEIRGQIIDAGFMGIYNKFEKKLGEELTEKLATPLVITPSYIGFRSILPDGSLMEEDKLSTIPFGNLIHLFTNIYRLWGDPTRAIKTFPKELQAEFDKRNIKYETWNYEDYGTGIEFKKELVKCEGLTKIGIELYDQRMISHWFTSPYYSLGMDITFFEGNIG